MARCGISRETEVVTLTVLQVVKENTLEMNGRHSNSEIENVKKKKKAHMEMLQVKTDGCEIKNSLHISTIKWRSLLIDTENLKQIMKS
jgi:peptide methionine sulfoxide reductase MsrA